MSTQGLFRSTLVAVLIPIAFFLGLAVVGLFWRRRIGQSGNQKPEEAVEPLTAEPLTAAIAESFRKPESTLTLPLMEDSIISMRRISIHPQLDQVQRIGSISSSVSRPNLAGDATKTRSSSLPEITVPVGVIDGLRRLSATDTTQRARLPRTNFSLNRGTPFDKADRDSQISPKASRSVSEGDEVQTVPQQDIRAD